MHPQVMMFLELLVLAVIGFVASKITGGPIFPLAMALTEDYDAPSQAGTKFSYGVATGKIIYAGAIVVLNATGYAEPATTALAKKTLGRACTQVDNSGGNDGDLTIEVEEGVFRYENSAAADEITIAEIGQACYLVDDQTVAKTSDGGTRSIAGEIRNVDDDGVWVELKNTFALDGDLVAANNLSDVADAITARGNIGADTVALVLDVADLVAANAAVYRIVSPWKGTIKKIYSVLEVHALAVGDATLTGKIGAVAITNGVVTITQAGSAVGDVDVATPTAADVVAVGDVISLTVGGANTDATATAKITILIKLDQ